jgi:hypothetical protein
MAGFGIGMTERDLECILCGAHFTRLDGDLVVPETLICEACLAEIHELDDEAIAGYVSRHLERDQVRVFQDRLIQHIRLLKQRGK